jgi:hypothetical protein
MTSCGGAEARSSWINQLGPQVLPGLSCRGGTHDSRDKRKNRGVHIPDLHRRRHCQSCPGRQCTRDSRALPGYFVLGRSTGRDALRDHARARSPISRCSAWPVALLKRSPATAKSICGGQRSLLLASPPRAHDSRRALADRQGRRHAGAETISLLRASASRRPTTFAPPRRISRVSCLRGYRSRTSKS